MIASTCSGTSIEGTTVLGAAGGSNMCLVKMPMKVSAVNGTLPVSNS